MATWRSMTGRGRNGGAAMTLRSKADADEPAAGDIAFCRASPVAELAGDVVATAMAGHDGHRGWLYDVAVDPSRRGESLGRGIVAHAEAWLASLGVRKLNLIIRDTNLDVQAFYARIGYAVEPRRVMARWLVDAPPAGGRR
ncbi:MAG: GNAT family N-acetyltransferase [Proteobacteria bacterium]|nr:GNAT family N-acetyltransferase [Pseudomonadota bacterium]